MRIRFLGMLLLGIVSTFVDVRVLFAQCANGACASHQLLPSSRTVEIIRTPVVHERRVEVQHVPVVRAETHTMYQMTAPQYSRTTTYGSMSSTMSYGAGQRFMTPPQRGLFGRPRRGAGW
jgi:hypothetical protein